MVRKYLKTVTFNEIIFENENFALRKICLLRGGTLCINNKLGLVRLIPPKGDTFEKSSIRVIILPDGTKMTELDAVSLDHFHEGRAKISVNGFNFGYIAANLKLVIPLKYSRAGDFKEGFALAQTSNNEVQFIDINGGEHYFRKSIDSGEPIDYKRICDISDGMFRVSDRFIEIGDWDEPGDDDVGNWGYVDSNGIEVIKPQYIYAKDFRNGFAPVCKGDVIVEGYSNFQSVSEILAVDNAQWGIIDKTGREVIPCKYNSVTILDNGTFKITEYNKKLKKVLVKIMDRLGNVFQDAQATDIIDADGTVETDVCKKNMYFEVWTDWVPNEKHWKRNKISLYRYGLHSLNGDVILPMQYDEILVYDDIVTADDKDRHLVFKIEKNKSVIESIIHNNRKTK